MEIGDLGRFAQNINSITQGSLRPQLEGLVKNTHAFDPEGIRDVKPVNPDKGAEVIHATPHGSFGSTLEGMLQEVSSMQHKAGQTSQQMLTGEVEDVHQVMVAVEKASTSFMLMMEIRNKLVEAYREVMRMQV